MCDVKAKCNDKAKSDTNVNSNGELFRGLKPVRVSPLIKLARWSFLIMGIIYGARRQSFLAKREVGIREEEEKLKKEKDALIAEEKRIASDRDIQYFADIAEGKIKG